jgi:hypothetical protein
VNTPSIYQVFCFAGCAYYPGKRFYSCSRLDEQAALLEQDGLGRNEVLVISY